MVRMGMDVDAVEKASIDLKSRAERLEATISAIDGIVNALPAIWKGKDSNDFVQNWWTGHRAKLVAVKDSVAGLGQSAWNNAQEQRQASGSAGSPASSSTAASPASSVSDGSDYTAQETADFETLLAAIKNHNTAHDVLEGADELLKALAAGKIDYKSFSEWMVKVKGLDAGTILSLAGMAISAKELGEAIGNDDPAAILGASLDLAMGVVGTKVPGAGFAWEIGKFLGESGYNSLQAFYDSPGSALDYAARQMYGDGATFDALEQYQRDALMTRYEGLPGLIASNGDHLLGAVQDVWTWITTGKGRGPRG